MSDEEVRSPKRGCLYKIWCRRGDWADFFLDGRPFFHPANTIPRHGLVLYVGSQKDYHKVIYQDQIGWVNGRYNLLMEPRFRPDGSLKDWDEE